MSENLIYKDYKASGKVTASGILLLIIATTIVGIIGGFVAAGIAQFVYLVFVFPLAMVAVGGWLVDQVGKTGKVRNRLLLAFFGLWIGALIYSTYWIGDYLFLVEDYYQEYREDGFTRFDAQEEISASLEEETGYPHVIGYVLWTIEGGLELVSSSPGSSDSSIQLNPQMTAIYWSVEALVVVLLTGVVAFYSSNKPFNETCNEWYEKADGAFVGYVLNENGKQFIQHLRAGELNSAAQLVNMDGGDTELYVYSFPNCNSDEILLKTVRHQGRNAVAVDGIMSKAAFEQFTALF